MDRLPDGTQVTQGGQPQAAIPQNVHCFSSGGGKSGSGPGWNKHLRGNFLAFLDALEETATPRLRCPVHADELTFQLKIYNILRMHFF